jgi:hypothetical protein
MQPCTLTLFVRGLLRCLLQAIQAIVNATIAGAKARLHQVNAQCSLEAGFVLQVAGDLDIKVRYMHIMQQGSVV